MSLVGSLEDLGLGDILQIVSLARKSGRLLLRTDGGTGRILVSEGMVRGAAIKGDREGLRALLLSAGLLTEAQFEQARELAEARAIDLAEAVVEATDISRERLDAVRREHVERSVIRMFSWITGEFSFEVREHPDPEDLALVLPTGINTQYLAMEASRLRDEGSLHGEPPEDEELSFSGEESAPEPAGETLGSALDVMALASARSVGSDEEADDTQPRRASSPEGFEVEERDASVSVEVEVPAASVSVDVEAPPAPVHVDAPAAAPSEPPPLVALDRNLTGLEWLKLCIGDAFPRVHIFQRDDDGMDRIRRYLARGVVPLVALSPDLLASDRDQGLLLARMRALSPEMLVFALLADGSAPVPQGFDGSLLRPNRAPDPDQLDGELATALREQFIEAERRASGSSGSRPRTSSALESLRSVSDRLRDPDRRDDLLSLVLEFAARDLSRVAVFMMRDDVALGMAQLGMPKAGGPDDDALRQIQLPRGALPSLLAKALEERRGVRGRIDEPDTAKLAELLGGTVPAEAYAAPIESGGCVAALLYADNLPLDAPIADTTALEIVLHEAGLALDRTLLERALAEARADLE